MEYYHHQNGVSGGNPDTPQFDFTAFASQLLQFVDKKVITECLYDYSKKKLTAHIIFGERCVKFSFKFCVEFLSDIQSARKLSSGLQKVVYEIPYHSPVDASLNDFVFAILRNEIKIRLSGALAETRVIDLIKEDLGKPFHARVLKYVTGSLVADTRSDKKGIDIRLSVSTAVKTDFLPIDIKSYKNGLLDIKRGVAGLFVDESMKDEIVLHKINILVEGFSNGEYLRI